jgi:hypothetical protein
MWILSPQTPWRTLLKVGVSTFQPGDVILFKRDGIWNEWLTPPSSGTAGNLIKFDAYGNGRPRNSQTVYHHEFTVDKYFRKRLADCSKRDASDLAIEVCAVWNDLQPANFAVGAGA